MTDISPPGSSQPLISVIVINYNGKKFLGPCLKSLKAQTFRDFDAWLVDNGSTDGSADFVRNNFPWVRILALPKNLGFCGGNNAGIRETGGEFVCLLNNDTLVDPAWLHELLRPMLQQPKIGIAASRILSLLKPDTLYAAGNSYSAHGFGFQRGLGMLAAGRFEEPEEVFTGCACAVLYRRSMLDEVGLFDEDFHTNYEDADLGFRARLAGYGCLYVPSAVVYHYGSGTTGFDNPRIGFLTSRNLEYVFFQDMPAPLLLRYLPLHLGQDAWGVWYWAQKGLGLAYLRGKVAFLANLPRVIKKRRRVQAGRKVSLCELRASMVAPGFWSLVKKAVRSPFSLPEYADPARTSTASSEVRGWDATSRHPR